MSFLGLYVQRLFDVSNKRLTACSQLLFAQSSHKEMGEDGCQSEETEEPDDVGHRR